MYMETREEEVGMEQEVETETVRYNEGVAMRGEGSCDRSFEDSEDVL